MTRGPATTTPCSACWTAASWSQVLLEAAALLVIVLGQDLETTDDGS